MFTVHFVRHGECEGEEEQIIHGQSFDAPLTLFGSKQMATTARYLQQRIDNQPIAHIHTSPLKRARQSAVTLARHIMRPGRPFPAPSIADELKDRSYGVLEGGTWSEYRLSSDMQSEKRHGPLEHAPDGGESFLQLCNRFGPWFASVTTHPDRHRSASTPEHIILLTHPDVIRIALYGLLGFEAGLLECFQIDPGSLTSVSYATESGWRIRCLNETGHLLGIDH